METSRKDPGTRTSLLRTIEGLQRRLDEAEQTVDAIRYGEVDAIVVAGALGEQIYTLTGAEHAYRVIVETMNEAALTTDLDGTILLCNQRFCDLMRTPMQEALGRKVTAFAAGPQRPTLEKAMADAQTGPAQQHVMLRAADGTAVPVLLSAGLLQTIDGTSLCLVASDLTELEQSANSIRVLREQRQALEASEERYRRFFMEDLTGDFLATPDGRLIECNPAFAEIYGFDGPDDAHGYDISQFSPSAWFRLIELVTERGKLYNHESWHQRPDGTRIYIVANIVGQFDDAGELAAIKGYVFENTGRKHAEEALHSVALFPEQNPSPVLRVARDGTLLYANSSSAALLELWNCRVGQALPDEVRRQVERTLDVGEATEAEVVCGEVTYSFSIAPIASQDYVNLYGRDITERKRAEEALAASERKYRELVETTNSIILRWDNQGIIHFVNEYGAHVFGYEPDELIGRQVKILVPDVESTGRDLSSLIQDILDHPEQYRHNPNENIKRDGSRLWITWANKAVVDERGKVREILAVGNDITALKETERQLHELTEELDARVAWRTAALEHRTRQLQKLSLELSQAEDRERRRLAEILHDDLQQQIAAAKFHVGLIRSRAKGDISLQKATAQVDEMLKDAVEKSRSLSHELSPAILQHGTLTEALGWLADQMKTKHGLTVHIEGDGRVNSESDALKIFLYRTVQELLFNVVKHARTSEARVRLRRLGRFLCLSVSDQGRGFDPQGLKATKGFGLLSICERIELMGGRMRIKSAEGRGSTFFIGIADSQEPEDGRRSTEGQVRKAAGAGPRARPRRDDRRRLRLRVLLVDDHKIVRDGLAALFAEESDLEVVGEASDGREAINQAYRLQPDVIVMDVGMPLMKGDEAAEQIKRHLPETRIVGLSMYHEKEAAERMQRAGAECLVLKTAPSEELLAAIRGKTPAKEETPSDTTESAGNKR